MPTTYCPQCQTPLPRYRLPYENLTVKKSWYLPQKYHTRVFCPHCHTALVRRSLPAYWFLLVALPCLSRVIFDLQPASVLWMLNAGAALLALRMAVRDLTAKEVWRIAQE